jgi:hypothetical protein
MGMRPEQLTALRRQQPFRPFRIKIADGWQLDVVHPEMILVGLDDVTIGFPRKNSDKPYLAEHMTNIDLSDILGVDFLEAEKVGANSQEK